jgi:hypothetical protein
MIPPYPYPESNRNLALIGRAFEPLNYRGEMVSRCSAALLPRRDRITVRLTEAAVFPDPEPPLGIEPRSARYQRSARPLSYGGAKWRKMEASNL